MWPCKVTRANGWACTFFMHILRIGGNQLIGIDRHSDGITIIGHAKYAEPGRDIVCAGISTLVQTLIQSIENLTKDNIQHDISPGRVDIKHTDLSEQGQLLIDSFFIGCEMIASEYPGYVRVTV